MYFLPPQKTLDNSSKLYIIFGKKLATEGGEHNEKVLHLFPSS